MRADGVTLAKCFKAIRMSNVDVGARTIELNKAEYVIRGLGFFETMTTSKKLVVKVTDDVPITVADVGNVSLGPALRRGVLDKGGAEAVGGVAVVRYGYNPLPAIKNVKALKGAHQGCRLRSLLITTPSTAEVEHYARQDGTDAFLGTVPNHDIWSKHLRGIDRDQWPSWANLSQVKVVEFYDRSGLIYETLGTLNIALYEEILVTIIVILVWHLRSSILISALLPLAVLMCFVAMKVFGVEANIVAFSGIAIAIGTMVDMGIVLCENILKQLDEAAPEENRLDVVFRASSEVGSAVLTAVATTVVSFLPVFTMIGAEGKLFQPLAFTKTFALIASVIVALTIIPPAAHILLGGKVKSVTQTSWWLRTSYRRCIVASILLSGGRPGSWEPSVCMLLGDAIPDRYHVRSLCRRASRLHLSSFCLRRNGCHSVRRKEFFELDCSCRIDRRSTFVLSNFPTVRLFAVVALVLESQAAVFISAVSGAGAGRMRMVKLRYRFQFRSGPR